MKKKLMLCLILCLMAAGGFSLRANAAAIATPKISAVVRKGTGNTTVKWGKIKGVTGYEIQYAYTKDFAAPKSVIATKAKTVSRKLGTLSTTADAYIRMRAYKLVNGGCVYSQWSGVARLLNWNSSWKYAGNSKIHSGHPVLFYTTAAVPVNKTICVNAGHGTKGGASKKTLCHPDGSAKVTGGSTGAGAIYATSINSGTSVKGGSEASKNLIIAQKLKAKLLASGYNVLMIREDNNTQLDNIARTVYANHYADAHVAIHFDSTNSNKGAFYIGVPNVSSYRNMEPVKSHWKQHNALGAKLISGLRAVGVKIWGGGNLALDLTQTSYSTIPSIDIEVGDRKTSTSSKNLNKIANGLLKGIVGYFN